MRRLLLVLLLIAVCAACTATPTPAVPMRALIGWQPQIDQLTQQDSRRGWQFNGQVGDAVHLTLSTKGDGAAMLTLEDAAGNALAQGDDLHVDLPADGVYTALVQRIAGSDLTYSLTLSYTDRAIPTATLTATPTPSATFTPTATFTPSPTPTQTLTPTPVYSALGTLTGSLQIGQSANGSYISVFERHIYLFSGSAGQAVTITMTASADSNLSPALTLFDPSGQQVATASASGNAATLSGVALTVNGMYIIQALGNGTGVYQISVQAATAASTPSS